MQVEGLPAWPSCLRPHGARGAAPGGSVTGLAWRALGEPLSCPRERWACALSLPSLPPLGPRRCQPSTRGAPSRRRLCASFCASASRERDRDAAPDRRQRGKPAARWGQACRSGCSLPLLRPTRRPFSAASSLSLGGQGPGPTRGRLVTACFSRSQGAGASGSECRQRGWNPPSGSRCQEA